MPSALQWLNVLYVLNSLHDYNNFFFFRRYITTIGTMYLYILYMCTIVSCVIQIIVFIIIFWPCMYCTCIIILSESNLNGLLENVYHEDSVRLTTTVTRVAAVPFTYEYRPEMRKLAEVRTCQAKFNNTLRHVCDVYGNRGIGIVWQGGYYHTDGIGTSTVRNGGNLRETL